MMKDVFIRMHSIQNSGEDDEETLDFVTDGNYFLDGDTACFSYLETEVTGLEGTRTSVFVRPREVVIDRDGMITGRMVFREGEKNSFLYSTPYGTATLGVNTKSLKKSFDENGGELEVDYVTDMEHAVVARNKIILKIEEQRGTE